MAQRATAGRLSELKLRGKQNIFRWWAGFGGEPLLHVLRPPCPGTLASYVRGGGSMGCPSKPHAQQTESHGCEFASSHCKADGGVQFPKPFAPQTPQCLHSADLN